MLASAALGSTTLKSAGPKFEPWFAHHAVEKPIFGRFFAIVRAALASLRIGLVS
jgi:hypothetical protein